DAGHHHSRCAVAALQSVLFGETLLHGVQLAALLEPLDGRHFCAVGLNREHGAGLHGLAIQKHGAGTAMRGVAADVGSRQAQHFADEVDQQETGLDLPRTRGPVHGECDFVHSHDHRPPARSTAFLSARATITRAISRLYSIEPRLSPLGALFVAASRAASAIVFSSGTLPTRERAASAASTGVGPAMVIAIAARSTAH